MKTDSHLEATGRWRARLAGWGLIVLLLSIAAPGAFAAPRPADDGWTLATSDHAWSFPRDHHAHPDTSIEWWYVTGLATDVDDPARRFGFQFTLFRIGLEPGDPTPVGGFDAAHAVMGHASVTDVARGDHRFLELFWRASPLLGGFPPYAGGDDEVLAWARAPAGTDDRWELRRVAESFRIEARDDAAGASLALALTPTRPHVFQGENGLSAKSSDGTAASLYYSFTRLATTGTITLDGRTLTVSGESWMDREFGSSQLGAAQVGWDWFALRLDDGRDLMLYHLRRADGSIDHAHGTLVGVDGEVEWLDPAAWSLEATETWTSPKTGSPYPSRWRLAVPRAGLDLVVRPLVPDQENVSKLLEDLRYWEGAVEVLADGLRVGEGYVELTGYGDHARLPL